MARNNTLSSGHARLDSFKHTSVAVNKKVQQQQLKQAGSPKKPQPSHLTFNVIQPTPICSHPDTGFESGAWLFDWSAAPQWFASQWSSSLPSSRASLLHVTQVNLDQHRKVSAKSSPMSLSYNSHQVWDNKEMMTDALGHDNPFMSAPSRRERIPTPLPTMALIQEPISQFAILQQSRPIMGRIPSPSPILSQSSAGPLSDSDHLLTTFYTRSVMLEADQEDRRHNYQLGVIPVGVVKAQHWSIEDGFDSGAWLFDVSVAPKWLANELFPSTKSLIATLQASPIHIFGRHGSVSRHLKSGIS